MINRPGKRSTLPHCVKGLITNWQRLKLRAACDYKEENNVAHHHLWEMIKTIYFTGFFLSLVFTFFVSKDRSMLIRLLCAIVIGLTWPMSFPVVVMFSFF